MVRSLSLLLAASSALQAAAVPHTLQERDTFVNQVTCNGNTYGYREQAGYGFLPSNAQDKYGDTLGGYGSSAALDKKSWKKNANGSYTGRFFALPDRGWNTQGTINYNPRVEIISFVFTPNKAATVANPSQPNLKLTYQDTILLKGPDGQPATGLDASATEVGKYPGFPDLPLAVYVGDGFGGAGPGGRRVSLDTEGIVVAPDGGFWISDEYGAYIYKFDSTGLMTSAIRPPEATIPLRNGTESFNANSPPIYDQGYKPIPAAPTDGRAPNQGLEGLSISLDGKTLYALMQSGLEQEGGAAGKASNQNTRFFQYDISGSTPVLTKEAVVTLPQYADGSKKKTAAQSEIFALNNNQYFVLARDSGSGHGQSSSTSVYRHIDIFDITGATNISPAYDAANAFIASAAGVLNPGITAAQYCSFVDFNINAQLNRFGVHNGGAQDAGLLNEKWESIFLAPVDGNTGADGEFYMFSFSDNDFVTQNGFYNYGKNSYADASGYNLDNQALVFDINLPSSVKLGTFGTYTPIATFVQPNSCIPSGYYQAQDLGQTTYDGLIARCEAQCTASSQCKAFTGQLQTAPNGLSTGQCYYYSTPPTAPAKCADYPTAIIGETKN